MTRRRSHCRILGLAVIFVATASFFFFKNANQTSTVDAYSLDRFDPGLIISDYVMGDYNSMTEEEIQEFLTKKNSCSNKDYDYYQYLSQNQKYEWHWKDDHFVCLSEELFGDGEIIGEGETAAHIIWQAAQDYKINPKVLIVLLEKETSLITDKIPNNGDYRKATGYGCPDFAACNEKYYGFKNQVRNAASMFHAVLIGGWTNYPLGINYIQYNPSKDCGGSEVDIKSLATSALYRYTPYQPNEGTIAAGYGTATCGAYGNRNFYLYFGDWFGDPTIETNFVDLLNPRYFTVDSETERINPYTNEVVDTIEKAKALKYLSKIEYGDSWCLRTEYNTLNKLDSCVPIEKLKEIELKYEAVPEDQQLRMVNDDKVKKTYIRGESDFEPVSKNLIRRFTKKTTFNEKTYYITEYDEKNQKSEYGILAEKLDDLPEYNPLSEEFYVELTENVDRINPYTKAKYDELKKGKILKIKTTVSLDKDDLYYRTKHNTDNDIDAVLPAKDTQKVEYEDIVEPITMTTTDKVNRVNPFTGEYYDTLEKGRVLNFSSKIKIGEKWFYRTVHNTTNKIDAVIKEDLLK